MKIIRIISVIVIILMFTNCNKNDDVLENEFTLETPDEIDNEEYEVYSAVFTNWDADNIVIQQKTSTSTSIQLQNSRYQNIEESIAEIDTTVLTSFIEKNSEIYYLGNLFSTLSNRVTLISEAEKNNIFSSQNLNGGWESFYSRYPDSNGFVLVTRVGLNTKKNQAVFEIGHFYGSLGAEGSIVFLKKENEVWHVVQTFHTWIS